MNFQADNLKKYVAHVLEKAGLAAKDSRIVGSSLVSADLRGVDSHGSMRLGIYVKRLRAGVTNANPEIKVVKESDTTILVDGDNGMGHVVGSRAMELGIAKAKQKGAAFVGVRRSTHFGIGSFYVQQGIAEDLITFAMSNAPSTMAPWGGIQPFFGTNPYAFGVPAGEQRPIILDMASSVVARGKIILAARKGEEIPEGWAICQEGRPCTNAQEGLDGSVLPFAGPKGYAFSLMVDIMCGVLTGSAFGSHINNFYGESEKPQNLGHFFQLIDIEHFIPIVEFKRQVDQMVNEVKLSPRAVGTEEIFLPGEIEFNSEKEKLKKGINLSEEVYEDIGRVGRECGIEIKDYHG